MKKEYTKEQVRELIDGLITQIDFLMQSRECTFEFIIKQSNIFNYNKNHKFVLNERIRLKESDTLIGKTSTKLNIDPKQITIISDLDSITNEYLNELIKKRKNHILKDFPIMPTNPDGIFNDYEH